MSEYKRGRAFWRILPLMYLGLWALVAQFYKATYCGDFGEVAPVLTAKGTIRLSPPEKAMIIGAFWPVTMPFLVVYRSVQVCGEEARR